MNQKNFEYLKDQVKFTGFGEGLEGELKEKMQQQKPDFQLFHSAKFGKDVAVAALQFKKSSQSDMYFFNRYNVTLKPDKSPDMLKQTFYINKGNNITMKEGYNLMSGRAVNKTLANKEGQLYNAWLQLDLKETDKNGNYKMKQFHQNYGFDLEKELAKHPVKELNNEQDKSRLLESLQRGNRQSVTFLQKGGEQLHFIEANPQFKSVNVYDSHQQRLNSKQLQEEKPSEKATKTAKQEVKKESRNQPDEEDAPEMPKAAKKRAKRKSRSIS